MFWYWCTLEAFQCKMLVLWYTIPYDRPRRNVWRRHQIHPAQAKFNERYFVKFFWSAYTQICQVSKHIKLVSDIKYILIKQNFIILLIHPTYSDTKFNKFIFVWLTIYILQKSCKRAQNNQQIEIHLGLVWIYQKINARHIHNLIL